MCLQTSKKGYSRKVWNLFKVRSKVLRVYQKLLPSEAYSEPCQIAKLEHFAKIVIIIIIIVIVIIIITLYLTPVKLQINDETDHKSHSL